MDWLWKCVPGPCEREIATGPPPSTYTYWFFRGAEYVCNVCLSKAIGIDIYGFSVFPLILTYPQHFVGVCVCVENRNANGFMCAISPSKPGYT